MASPRIGKILTTVLSPKVGLPLMLLVALVCAPLLYRSSQLAGLPDIGDPFDVQAFCDIEISDEENAYVEYRQAAAMLVDMPMPESADYAFYEALYQGWAKGPPEHRQWVDDNRAAMIVWRKGTVKPDAIYIDLAHVDFHTELNVIADRDFMRLANLEGSRLEAEGKPEEAWQWYRAAFRSSRHVGRYGTILERMVGGAQHGVVAKSMVAWASNPRVDKAMLQTALENISFDYTMSAPVTTGLKVEYLSMQNSLQWFISGMGSNVTLFFRNEPELSRRVFQHFFTEKLAQHAEPGTVPSTQQNASQAVLKKQIKRSFIVPLMLPSVSDFATAVTIEQARQAALEMTLAAQIYYRDQGRFPETADQLLKSGLESIPVDPFSPTGEPMQYRIDQSTGEVVVWSIGKDKTDNGGDFETNAYHPPPDHGYRIHAPAAEGSP